MSDDISMGAPVGARSASAPARRSRPAAIWCFIAMARMPEMLAVAAAAPLLADEAARRAAAALWGRKKARRRPIDLASPPARSF